MTTTEMTEVFAVIVMAWPSSEIAKLGKREMSLKVSFWTQFFESTDALYVKTAIMELCKTSKFAPSIMELLEEANRQEKLATDVLRLQYRYFKDFGEENFYQIWGDKLIPLMKSSESFGELQQKYLAGLQKTKELKA